MIKPDVLKNAQDFAVIGPAGRNNYVYAAKPSLDVMKQFYEQSIANPDDKNIDAFSKCWKFDEKKGITGSSSWLALRFDKQALRPQGLWLPGLLEGKILDEQGKLSEGVYRDYDFVVYDENEPNKKIAERLVSQAKQLGLELPLIVPFKAMDYKVEERQVMPSFIESPKGILSGKNAQSKINLLTYQGNSGVQTLFRSRDGDWGADWDDLDYSDDDGRGDWICGEATKKFLEHAYSKLNERKYNSQERELKEKLKELKSKQKIDISNFKKSLKR